MTGTESERDYIQSIERGFAVLLAFDEDLPNPSLAEVAAVTGLSGAVVAALAPSTSSGRSDPERLARDLAPLLVRTADRISTDLGHRASTTRRSVVLEGRDGFF